MGRSRKEAPTAAALLLLGACVAREPGASLQSRTAAQEPGCAETRIAPDHYRVSCRIAAVPLPQEAAVRAEALEEQGRRAYELALRRAAETALAGGYSRLVPEPAGPEPKPAARQDYIPQAAGVYGPGGMIYPQWIYNPGVAYYGRPGIGPYWIYDDPFAEAPSAGTPVSATLDVRFSRTASPGSLDAAAVLAAH